MLLAIFSKSSPLRSLTLGVYIALKDSKCSSGSTQYSVYARRADAPAWLAASRLKRIRRISWMTQAGCFLSVLYHGDCTQSFLEVQGFRTFGACIFFGGG